MHDGEELQSSPALEQAPSPERIIEWLSEGQRRLRGHIAALGDQELLEPRRQPEGEMKETRWIIAVMIEHDLYHAGEINHVRPIYESSEMGMVGRVMKGARKANSDGILPEGSIGVSAPLNSRPRTVRIATTVAPRS